MYNRTSSQGEPSARSPHVFPARLQHYTGVEAGQFMHAPLPVDHKQATHVTIGTGKCWHHAELTERLRRHSHEQQHAWGLGLGLSKAQAIASSGNGKPFPHDWEKEIRSCSFRAVFDSRIGATLKRIIPLQLDFMAVQRIDIFKN